MLEQEAGTRTLADLASPALGPAIRVLSYNIQGQAALTRRGHLAGIARVIIDERPDVVGLQEVHRGTWRARFRDQAAELGERTGMEVLFGRSAAALGGEFGNAVLTRGRIVDSEVVPLPSFGEPRSLLHARLDLDGFDLDVLVTHLVAWGSLNRAVRTAQVRHLVERLQRGRRRFVLCGDLNSTPRSADLAALLQGDIVRLCGLAGEPTHGLLGRRLDYIFSDPGGYALAARVLRHGPSDHWAVSAHLAWPVESAEPVRPEA